MQLFRRVGRRSIIYTATNVLQRAIGFLLLPLYTRFLTPGDYGILAVVTAINGFIVIFLTLSLHGAMTRFYFEYRDQPDKLREFWGTVLTLILTCSLLVGGALLVFGESLLRPVIGHIPFWPFVALGILAVMFQPFFSIYLYLLQTREQAGRYGLFSFAHFLLNVSIIISLVVFAGWGAEGPLTASLATAVLFFLVSMYTIRKDVKLGFNLVHLREALRYSLPIVPHALAGQVLTVTDKLFINTLVSTASAGLYNIGFQFANIVSILAESVNRAWVPAYMDILQSDRRQDHDSLRRTALLSIVLYCLVASVISIFARELVMILTSAAFSQSYTVVALISFGFVLNGIYYVLVNVLFFEKTATKYVSVGTGLAAASNILLNLWLIPIYGLTGAALAAFTSHLLATLFIGIIGCRYERVRWEYGKMALLFAVAAGVSIGMSRLTGPGARTVFGIKAAALGALFLLLNLVAWGDPCYLLKNGGSHVRALLGKQVKTGS